MVNTDKLRGIIAERGLSQQRVAKLIGMSGNAFYLKMKKRVFLTSEAEKLIETLGIEKPEAIFFDGTGA